MKRLLVCFAATVLLSLSGLGYAQVAVTTYQNDNYRSGSNTHETMLTTSNVNSTQFGRLAVFNVVGYVYAQPLYVPNVNINGTRHNVVYVATEHDQVYAFDANSGQQLWVKNLLITIGPLIQVTPVSSSDVGCGDLVPEIGITGTPVIDVPNNEMFLVAKTKEHNLVTHTTQFFQTLYALDIRTGQLRNPPRRIAGQVPGTGQGSQGGSLTFDPLVEGQRAALLLSNGHLIGSWASHCDLGAYHGWMISYDEIALLPNGIFVDTPNGSEGGFWAAGSGPAADSAGSIYVPTGNGSYDDQSDYGDSILRLTWSNSGLALADYFTPWDQLTLDFNDTDVASGGVTLLPDQPGTTYPHLLVQVGKEGTIDLVNRDNMGHFHAGNDDQIVQTLPFIIGGVWGGPAFWNNNAYFGGSNDHLKAFAFNPQTQLLSAGPTSESSEALGYPGPTPAVSSNGTSNGIVWIVETDTHGAAAILHAYNANNLASELYNSAQNPSRDSAGIAVKFTVPTIADGHVFVGGENEVAEYGLLH
ncbi:MAG TPA: pyrrolo-quinoline quinone [Candidatus Bathyarchaeia archaeon]|nr:pyrrolo-quinoline quinone [Candidatus Bathyarchaeia archaeon]